MVAAAAGAEEGVGVTTGAGEGVGVATDAEEGVGVATGAGEGVGVETTVVTRSHLAYRVISLVTALSKLKRYWQPFSVY